MSYKNNIKIKLESQSNSGRSDLTISNYEWKINNIIQQNNTNTLIVDTSTVPLGNNTISLRIQNSYPCNKWSSQKDTVINIIRGVNMQKDTTILVDKPTMSINVVMDLVSTVNVTVTDPLGNPIPNATAKIGTITTLTDVNGLASLTNVPYGTQLLSVIT